jgi:hypothetical protein
VSNRRFCGFFLFLSLMSLSMIGLAADFEDDYAAKPWEEMATQLPLYPKKENLLPFFVSSASDNLFMLDSESITVGSDGVVRYTLVVTSASGAQNVSYEGLRCASAERRLYAFGRPDNTWSKARSQQWVRLQNPDRNRQHAALYSEYLCPNGSIVGDAAEARAALRAGGHYSLKDRYR